MTTLVATFYHLVPLPQHAAWQPLWRAEMLRLNVRGTILLTPEGVNATIAGPEAGVRTMLAFIRGHAPLAALQWKESWAETNPFPRTKVKLKRETIPLGHPVNPAHAGTYVKPADWNALINQPGVITIDTRNAYEVALGHFTGAQNPATRTFKELPDWLQATLPADRATPIAMYCTGGIRCEKSTAYLKEQGYTQVYHLEGGILKYLEEVNPAESLWQGACYVFDDRVAVDHALQPVAELELCPHCTMPLIAADLRRAKCPHCHVVLSLGLPAPTEKAPAGA